MASLTLLTAACGASGGSEANKDTTTTTTGKVTTTERPTTTKAETTSTTLDGAAAAQLQALIGQVLLRPDDVGVDGFVASKPKLSPEAPCGLNLQRDFPSVADGATQLVAEDKGVALVEVIRVYPSENDAGDAYDAILDTGLGCPESTDGSTKITSLGDVSADVAPTGVDLQAEAFGLDAAEVQGTTYVVQYVDSVVVLQFAAQPGAAELGGLPDTAALTKTAVTKIDDNLPN